MRIARALSVVGVLMALLNSCSQRIPLTTDPQWEKMVGDNPVQSKIFINQDQTCVESSETSDTNKNPCVDRLEFWFQANKVNVFGATSWIGLSYDLITLLKMRDSKPDQPTLDDIPPVFDVEQIPALIIDLPKQMQVPRDLPPAWLPTLTFEILDNGTALKNKSGQVFVQNSEF